MAWFVAIFDGAAQPHDNHLLTLSGELGKWTWFLFRGKCENLSQGDWSLDTWKRLTLSSRVRLPEAGFGLRFGWWSGNSPYGARSGADFGGDGQWSGRGGGLGGGVRLERLVRVGGGRARVGAD
jgi:hypothetical protein